MTTPIHAAEDLRPFASRHLPYELEQLIACAEMLAAPSPGVAANSDFAPYVNNALLESFLVHLRTLDDFLGARRGRRGDRPKDVLAIDYLPRWNPRRFLDAATRDAVNAQLAHLSVDRKRGVDVQWSYVLLALTAVESFACFVGELRKSEESREWFDALGPAVTEAGSRLRHLIGESHRLAGDNANGRQVCIAKQTTGFQRGCHLG